MSNKENIDELKAAFGAALNIFDEIFKYDGPFPEGKSESFIEQYERLGALDWHQFYGKESEAVNLLFDEFAPEIVLTKIQDNSIIKDIAHIEKQLNSLNENLSPKQLRDLKDKALTSGIRWMIISRVLKVSLISCFRYQIPISELINLSKEGDINAFLKLVKLDSTFLATGFGGKFLRKIELKQDPKLKEKLAKSLKPEENFWTLKHPRKNLRDALALWILSNLGYVDKSYSLWADFMDDQGFENLTTEQNIASIVKRYKIPKKHPKRRKNLDT